MKKINQYIDSVYQDFDGSEEEIRESKEEMRSHLLEIVEELKLEGKSEKEAVQLAIDRFGDKTTLSDGLMEFFEGQKLFAKKLLWFSIGVFIVGVITLSWAAITSPNASDERKELSDRIAQQINDDSELSLEEKNNIEKVITSFNGKFEITHLSIYSSDEGMETVSPLGAEYVYLGMEHVPEVLTSVYELNDKWIVLMQQDKQKNYLIYFFTLCLFIVFGVLIIVWIVLNSYIKKYIKGVS